MQHSKSMMRVIPSRRLVSLVIFLAWGSMMVGCRDSEEKGSGNSGDVTEKNVSPATSRAPLRPGMKHSENRTALVLCVSDYEKAEFLSLPGVEKDKEIIRDTLDACGFSPTQIAFCPTLEEANQAIDDFLRLLEERGGTGLFYFSGHGAAHNGTQYLLLGREPIADPGELGSKALRAEEIMRRMEETGTETSVVLLDCCRTPFIKDTSALASQRMRSGSFYGYATSGGEPAVPGPGGSPYTVLLSHYMKAEGSSLTWAHVMVQREFRKNLPRIEPMHASKLTRFLVFDDKPVRPLEKQSGDTRLFGGIPFAWCPGPTPGEGFWLSRTEITKAQWQRIMGGELSWPEMYSPLGRLPMTQVSWNDALAFCHELNAEHADERGQGRAFNLPTEAQWESACRAGTRTAYFFGNDPDSLHRYANFSGETTRDPEVLRKFQVEETLGAGSVLDFDKLYAGQKREQEKFQKEHGLPGKTGKVKIEPIPDLQDLYDQSKAEGRPFNPAEALYPRKPASAPKPEPIPEPVRGKEPVYVGSHLPNPWGFHDMPGNVAEWVLKTPNTEALRLPGSLSLMTGEEGVLGGGRTVRGGSYRSHALQCRSDSRVSSRLRNQRYPDVGFRIVLGTNEVPSVPAYSGKDDKVEETVTDPTGVFRATFPGRKLSTKPYPAFVP